MTTLGLQWLQHLETQQHNRETELQGRLKISQDESQFKRELKYKYDALLQDWKKHADDMDLGWAKQAVDKMRAIIESNKVGLQYKEHKLRKELQEFNLNTQAYDDVIERVDDLFDTKDKYSLPQIPTKVEAIMLQLNKIQNTRPEVARDAAKYLKDNLEDYLTEIEVGVTSTELLKYVDHIRDLLERVGTSFLGQAASGAKGGKTVTESYEVDEDGPKMWTRKRTERWTQ